MMVLYRGFSFPFHFTFALVDMTAGKCKTRQIATKWQRRVKPCTFTQKPEPSKKIDYGRGIAKGRRLNNGKHYFLH